MINLVLLQGRKPGRPRTVKNLLDSSEKEKTQALAFTGIKTEALSREGEPGSPLVQDQGLVKVKEESESVSDSESHAQTVFSQSKLFQQNSMQGSTSASMNHSQAMERGVPNLPVHQAAMFYPQTFVPLGGLHHLGLPIMNQLPMGMPRFYNHPATSEKQQSYRPNILRNSQKTPQEIRSIHHASSKPSGYPLSKSVDTAPSRQSVSLSSASSSRSSPKSLMVPPAHSNGLKRSFSSNHPHITNASATNFANKSLLFDFESPKRPKLDIAALNKSDCTEEPTDLSMKTLKRKESSDTIERNGTPSRESPEYLGKRERSPTPSHPPVQSSPASTDTLSDIPHSVFSKHPSAVFRTSDPLSGNMVDLSKGPASSSHSQEGPKSMKLEEKSQEFRPSKSTIRVSNLQYKKVIQICVVVQLSVLFCFSSHHIKDSLMLCFIAFKCLQWPVKSQ